ncbi:MAG: tetratricopeptide repeat protein, partial [Candidatus Desulfofervidus sp.]|nr:tetratricopeptide repeat protein [Candidatus Desulfofervidus sp.]
LLDWMVPVLYQQEYSVVPIPEEIGESEGGIEFAKVKDKCPEGRYRFIGRDSDILRIERALRDSSCVLITGMSGIGKTELAYGFARWFAETGGCPGGVFVSSFKGGGNIGKVLGDILGYATDWSRYTEEEQKKEAIKYLREHPCLIIWDNFETVSGYPEGAEPLSTEEDRRKLAEFLQALRGGKTHVLITTRKPEERWLGVAYSLIELKGLAYRDAVLLANRILQTVGRKSEDFKDDENYPELLRLLHGHPRAMEVVLPQLRWKTPSAVIEELQHNLKAYPEILDASSEYAFSQMPEEARKHLLLLCLFTSFVNLDILRIFVAGCGEVYRAVIGEPPADAGDYEHIMNEAVQNGFINRLQNHIYQLHPSLPPFLRHRLMESAGEGGVQKLDTEFLKFYADFAAQLDEEVRNANQEAVSIVEIEELNFLRALRIAVKTEQWALAQAIAQTLDEFYEIRGRFREWSALRSSLLNHTGREISIDAPRNLANLWMFLLGNEANEALRENRIDDAEHSHKTIIQYLQTKTLPEPEAERKIAVCYHQLGMIAQERQQFDVAEQWYRKALEIFERLSMEKDAADDYHQLGTIAEERQQLDVAEQWYRKALEIRERQGLGRYVAYEYHQLGIIAQKRQQFDVAEQWYREALEIYDKIGHPPLKVDT